MPFENLSKESSMGSQQWLVPGNKKDRDPFEGSTENEKMHIKRCRTRYVLLRLILGIKPLFKLYCVLYKVTFLTVSSPISVSNSLDRAKN
jgi:hypothetical protein